MNLRALFILPLAAVAILAPAAADASAATTARFPSISKIDPLNLAIGETMTVSGRNFVPGKNKNTVVFKRDKQRAVFAKAVSATTRKLKVVVPEKVRPFLAKRSGAAVPTKFRIRILSRRFGKRYTALDASPTIAPAQRADVAPANVTPADAGPPPPPPDCDQDGQIDDVDIDDDNDHMTDAFEQAIGTDRCKLDTDGDGLSDFWEYESALDLNLRALPYPGKRPYPNALFPDQDVDYDGDGMLAWQEHAMWVRYGNMSTVLNYSDGTQNSDPDTPVKDDARDVDGDGLSNWVEANGPGRRAWWHTVFENEVDYEVVYGDLDFLDPDTDGDGRLDGADDIDHDGYANSIEVDRWNPLPDKFDASAPSAPRWVQMFNPCLPDPESPTCALHPPAPLSQSYPPFNITGLPVPTVDPYLRPLPWPAPPPNVGP